MLPVPCVKTHENSQCRKICSNRRNTNKWIIKNRIRIFYGTNQNFMPRANQFAVHLRCSKHASRGLLLHHFLAANKMENHEQRLLLEKNRQIGIRYHTLVRRKFIIKQMVSISPHQGSLAR